ncbi:hypothetical protein CDAR_410621 [Caerostris darwini]|uniref:Uncharacterized protein n=1 Tax=Caerostris darwini TaxID=1538125 RepID=A0AAV4N9C6_9ARAC|nr:hypothetical protein CDAR_410621 [Caerostris darwini]
MFHKIGPRPDPCGIPLSYGWFTSPKVTLLSCRKLCKIALSQIGDGEEVFFSQGRTTVFLQGSCQISCPIMIGDR